MNPDAHAVGYGSEPVFFVDTLPPPGRFVLSGPEGRHAATVKRLRPTERVIVSDGRGARAAAEVRVVERGTVTLDIGPQRLDPPPALQVVLIQALPKGEHSELAVDLATQAGVDGIVPFQAERCVARWNASAEKAERGRAKWQTTARAAAKQARRSRIPEIRPLARLAQVVDAVQCADVALVLHGADAQPLRSVPLPASGELVMVVGPEGGLTPAEVSALVAAGAQVVRLGPEVLRCSAAGAVALGALGALTDRWGT